MSSNHGAAQPEQRSQGRTLAAAAVLLHAVVALGWGVFFVTDTIGGGSDNLTRALSATALIVLAGVGLTVMALAWWRGRDWPRTPTMLWAILLLPVAWSLFDAGWAWIAVGIAVTAGLAFLGALVTPPSDPLTRDPEVS